MTLQEIKTKNMEETLFDKMLNEVQLYFCFTEMQEDAKNLTKKCERVAIQEQIELLQELQKDTLNTNANFRLKLILKINELENQLS